MSSKSVKGFSSYTEVRKTETATAVQHYRADFDGLLVYKI